MSRRHHKRNPAAMLRKMTTWRPVDKEVLALSLLTAGEGFHSFSSFMPSWFTIRTLALQPDSTGTSTAQKVANLRSGYAPSVLFALGMGAVVSLIAEHPLPLMTTSVASVLMVAAYESALPPGTRYFGAAATPAALPNAQNGPALGAGVQGSA